MTADELADWLGVSVAAVRQWAKRGRLATVRRGEFDPEQAIEVKHDTMPGTWQRRLAALAQQL